MLAGAKDNAVNYSQIALNVLFYVFPSKALSER